MSKTSPQPPSTPALALGRTGEELAAAYLCQLGFRIVAANFIVPAGRNRNDAVVNLEIDLVAYEGPVLCFVEVKTRASDWFAPPTANVDLRKQRQITRAARVYRKMFGLEDEPYRFDVVSIVLPQRDESTSETPPPTDSGSPSSEALFQIDLFRNFWPADKFNNRRRLSTYWE
jgi:putative endonuclease